MPYYNIRKHFDFSNCIITSFDATLPTLPKIESKEQ